MKQRLSSSVLSNNKKAKMATEGAAGAERIEK